MPSRNGVISISIASVLTMCTTGCVHLFSDHPNQWWAASITDIVRQSEIPPKVDRYCSSVSEKEGTMPHGAVVIASIRMGRRMPSYKQAFPLGGGQLLQIGDSILVQPRSCKIKRFRTLPILN